MWYNSNGMIYGWYSAGYSLMELVASPDSPAMVTGDVSGRNSVLVHIDGVETDEDASAITSITWSVRSPTGALMDYPLDPDIVFQSLPPLPAGRRLRFFEEGKEYLFFRFQIPQEMLTEPGAGAITPRFKVGDDFKAGTLLTYAVFKGNANDEDSLITKSQYDYLLAYVDRGITEAEGDERWVRLDPDGTIPTSRMQTITGDIRISSSDALVPDSFLIVGGYNGNPALSSKKGRTSSTTTLNLYPKEGTLSAPVVLNTPDDGGTLATREWVQENAGDGSIVFPKIISATASVATGGSGHYSLDADISELTADDIQLILKSKIIPLKISGLGGESPYETNAFVNFAYHDATQGLWIMITTSINHLTEPSALFGVYTGGSSLHLGEPFAKDIYLQSFDGNLKIPAPTYGNITITSSFTSTGNYNIDLANLYQVGWEDYPD